MGTVRSRSDPTARQDLTPFPLTPFPLIAAGIVLLCTGALSYRLGAVYAHDWDEGVYLGSARLMLEGEAQYRQVFSSQPPLFLDILTLGLRLFGDTVVAGRGLMVASALLTLVCAGSIAWRLFCPAAGVLTILAMALSSDFLHQARTCQAEILALGFGMAALWCSIVPTSRSRFMLAAASGLMFACGLLCKFWLAPYTLPALAFLLFPAQSTNWHGLQWVSRADWKTGLARIGCFALIVLSLVLLLFAAHGLEAVYDQAVRFHVEAKRVIAARGAKNGALSRQWLAAHSGVLLLALFGWSWLARSRSGLAVVFLAWLGAVVAFLSSHFPLFRHHIVLLLPVLALLAGASASALPALWSRSTARLALALGAGGLVCATSVTVTNETIRIQPSWIRFQHELASRTPRQTTEAIEILRQRTGPFDRIASDEPMLVFRADRRMVSELCDTSYVRIRSGYLDWEKAARAIEEEAAMVLLWSGRLRTLPFFRHRLNDRFFPLRTFRASRGFPREIFARKRAYNHLGDRR